MQASIAVDASRRRIVVRTSSATGTVVDVAPGLDPAKPLAQQWAQVVEAVLEARPHLQPTGVGVSSAPLLSSQASDVLRLLEHRGVTKVAVATEGVAAYLGALGNAEGAVLHAGTGTVCLACGPLGVAQVDGWGPIFGNAGSAFWIGRTAIEAGLRGHDGRRQLTALTELVHTEFPGLESAQIDALSPDFVAAVADFAPKVDAIAATDRVAANILDKAAAHLAEAVQAAIRRAGLTSPSAPHVAGVGSVFESSRVRSRFCDYLTLHWPNFALVEPAGDRLDGAAALLTLGPTHPLYRRISIAEKLSPASP